MSKLIKLEYQNKAVRALQIDGEAWFIVNDVCTVLGFYNPFKALGAYVAEDDHAEHPVLDRDGRAVRCTFVNVFGLGSLAANSADPFARHFKRWVSRDGLPAILKSGVTRDGGAPETPPTRRSGNIILQNGEVAAKSPDADPGTVLRAAMVVIGGAAALL